LKLKKNTAQNPPTKLNYLIALKKQQQQETPSLPTHPFLVVPLRTRKKKQGDYL